MGQYFFILGREPELSQAELEAVFARYRIHWKLLDRSPEALVVATSGTLPEGFLRNLGGCPKMGRMIESKDLSLPTGDRSRRIVFGFSVYAGEERVPSSFLERTSREWTARGLQLKKQLREQGIAARLVTSRERALSSVVVAKNKLIANG